MIGKRILVNLYIKFVPWADIDKKIMKLYRKSNKAYVKGYRMLAKYYSYKIRKKYNCIISPTAELGKNIIFPHPTGIVIGEGVKIGDNCVIYQNVTLGRKEKEIPEYPHVEENVVIYANSVVIGNIVIGKNSIIGCNSVVLKTINPNSKCAGVIK